MSRKIVHPVAVEGNRPTRHVLFGRFLVALFGAITSQSLILWLIFAPTYRAAESQLLVNSAMVMMIASLIVGGIGMVVGRINWAASFVFGLLVGPAFSLAIAVTLNL